MTMFQTLYIKNRGTVNSHPGQLTEAVFKSSHTHFENRLVNSPKKNFGLGIWVLGLGFIYMIGVGSLGWLPLDMAEVCGYCRTSVRWQLVGRKSCHGVKYYFTETFLTLETRN